MQILGISPMCVSDSIPVHCSDCCIHGITITKLALNKPWQAQGLRKIQSPPSPRYITIR